jgi:8-oxo-dGTP pyrophosphatase MutT (NUDIX family)
MSKRRLTVEAVVIDAADRVLLVRQGRTRHDWELPGGKVRKHESLLEALHREVQEETQIHVVPQRLIGVYFIRDGSEVYHDFIFVCGAKADSSPPRPNPPEIAECGFFDLDQLPEPIGPFTRRQIAGARLAPSQLLPVNLEIGDWVR